MNPVSFSPRGLFVTFVPSYIALTEQGDLKKRVHALEDILKDCRLCPRECRANRLEGEVGYCKADSGLIVSSAFPHFGEGRKPTRGISRVRNHLSTHRTSDAFSARTSISVILEGVKESPPLTWHG